MKTSTRTRFAAALCAALAGWIAAPPGAQAIPLVWLNGPEAGQAFAGGGITIKAFNYDTGTLYDPLTVGTSAGYSGSPGAGVAGGVTALDGLTQRGALGGAPGEDSWGLVKITLIQAIGSDGALHSIYNADASTFELTALFWGVQDFHLSQVAANDPNLPGSGQIIDGVGLRVDIYSDSTPDFSQTAGPLGGHAGNTYATVTDGTLELSLLSTPGFINAVGTHGGTASEFQSNTAATGYSALNVIGGSAETMAQFNTNSIGYRGSSGAGFTPGLAGSASADIWFAFTATQGDSGWDINSNDPMLANIAGVRVSDSGASVALFALAVPFLAVFRRRRVAASA